MVERYQRHLNTWPRLYKISILTLTPLHLLLEKNDSSISLFLSWGNFFITLWVIHWLVIITIDVFVLAYSFLMIVMLMSFELIWCGVWKFEYFSPFTFQWIKERFPPFLLSQSTIFRCFCSTAVALNNIFPASSLFSCISLDMLFCALWQLLDISIAFTVLRVVKKP